MADSYAALCARLSAADHEKARRLAAEAPPFDAQTEAFLRRILAPAAERVARTKRIAA